MVIFANQEDIVKLSHSALQLVARLLGGVAAIGTLALAASTASAATITVTTDIDEFDTSPNLTCSLREAIQSANQNSDFGGCNGSGAYGADTIAFAPGISVITLTITSSSGGNDNNAYLDLDVVVDQAPNDTTPFTLTILGGNVQVTRTVVFSDRIFDILTPTVSGHAAGGVRIEDLHIQNGHVVNPSEETIPSTNVCYLGGAGIRHRSRGLLEIVSGTVRLGFAARNGGGICQVGGYLRLVNSPVVESNQAPTSTNAVTTGLGGGIYISGTAELTATVQQNVASRGGGIYIAAGSLVTIADSSLSNNLARTSNAHANGGGIYNSGTANLTNTQMTSNTASGYDVRGGGIYNNGTANLTNTQVTSNTASGYDVRGGGIVNLGTARLTNTQVQGNVASGAVADGGGIYNSGTANLTNSQVTSNTVSGGLQASGGGIYSNGTANLTNSQVASNTASSNFSSYSGGIVNFGIANLTNTQVSGNTADGTYTYAGGIYNSDTANLTNSRVTSNTALGKFVYGGGIYNSGTVNLTNSQVASNTASASSYAYGGGIYNYDDTIFDVGTANLTNTQVTGNRASATNIDAYGGGIYNDGTANLTNSQVTSNTASSVNASGFGGGAYSEDPLRIQNSTFSANSAPIGSGLFITASNSVFLTFTTVASNVASGGIVAIGNGAVTVHATLLAYNAGGNCTGSITDTGFSMSSDATCTNFTFTNTNPLLQPLALNGGQTLNHALSPGSPALDKVPTPCPLGLDQRSVTRPQGQACDIGAFELEESDLTVSKSADPSPVFAGQAITYTLTVTNLSASGVANNIVLTDALLGGATFGGVVSSGGFAVQSSSPTQIVFTLPSLAAGSSATLVFTATVPASGPITNTATVISGNPDPDLNNNTITVTTPVTPVANLVVSKSATPSAVFAGDVVTYVVTLTNSGPSTATNVVITDVLQGGATFSSVIATSSGVMFSGSTSTSVTFTVSSLGIGSSVVMTYTAVTLVAGFVTNTVTAAADEVDSDTTNNTAGTIVTVTALADLMVHKSAIPESVFAGQTITYAVTVTNLSAFDAASSVVLTDVLLGGATFGGVVSSDGFTVQSSSPTQVVFTLPSLAAGSSVTLVFTATVPASGPITNTVTITSSNPDPDLSNNIFTVSTPVTPVANLAVSKSATPNPVIIGSVVTYVVTVTNGGPLTATNMVITDVLQGGATFSSVIATSSGVMFSGSTSTSVTFTVSSLGVGSSAVMTYTVVALTDGVITNTVTARANEPDSDTTNNIASTTVAVKLIADVRVIKTTPITQMLAGQPAFYAIAVQNLGPMTATNIVITDVFQGGAEFGGVIAASGSVTLQSNTNTAVTFTVPTLPNGGLVMIAYSVIAPPTGTITNTVTVSTGEFDPQPVNDIATINTTVTPVANFSINKTQSLPMAIHGTVTPTAQLTYTILVTNNGPSQATNVVITDILPAGLIFVSASGSNWTCGSNGQIVTCTLNLLSVGAAPAVQIVASAPVTPGLVLTNTAVVGSDTYPGTPVSSNIVSVKVQHRALLPVVRRQP